MKIMTLADAVKFLQDERGMSRIHWDCSDIEFIEIAESIRQGPYSSKVKKFDFCCEQVENSRVKDSDVWVVRAKEKSSGTEIYRIYLQTCDGIELFITDERALSDVSPTFRRQLMKEVKNWFYSNYAPVIPF